MILRIKIDFKPLAVILKENKLIGPNYIDRKRNLNIMLTTKEYKFVLTKVCLQQPGEWATDEEIRTYQKWKKVDEMSWCYILASMLDVLQHQHQAMSIAYDIMLSPKEIFRDQNHADRFVAMKRPNEHNYS